MRWGRPSSREHFAGPVNFTSGDRKFLAGMAPSSLVTQKSAIKVEVWTSTGVSRAGESERVRGWSRSAAGTTARRSYNPTMRRRSAMRPFRASVWGCALRYSRRRPAPRRPRGTTCSRRAAGDAGTTSDGQLPAAPPCNCQQPCQPQCTTRYVQRCYYQPVTTYQQRSYYEPVTTYKTSYYYEPVTSYRYSCYYDPCTCQYQQVATPCTSYRAAFPVLPGDELPAALLLPAGDAVSAGVLLPAGDQLLSDDGRRPGDDAAARRRGDAAVQRRAVAPVTAPPQ